MKVKITYTQDVNGQLVKKGYTIHVDSMPAVYDELNRIKEEYDAIDRNWEIV